MTSTIRTIMPVICLSLITMVQAGLAEAAPIDLNDFFGDPTVVVAGDGSSASWTEDPFFSTVILANDPGLGDPEVIIAEVGTSLSFEYNFSEGVSGNDDQFLAFILDAATGASVGAAYEFSTNDSASGLVSYDLTSLAGLTLGLQFELIALAGDSDYSSTLTVSNVDLTRTVSVYEPSTQFLLILGLIVSSIRLRKRA